jgi:hypothetical protein
LFDLALETVHVLNAQAVSIDKKLVDIFLGAVMQICSSVQTSERIRDRLVKTLWR